MKSFASILFTSWCLVSSAWLVQAQKSTTGDRDYDGRSDAQEHIDGTNPSDPRSCLRTRLGYWRFNHSDWRGEKGELPLRTEGVQMKPGFDGNALQITNAKGSQLLVYRDVEANGLANINCQSGAIRFWYRPFWSSRDPMAPPGFAWGKGPGTWTRLLELGTWTPDSSKGFFALSIDPLGTNLVLQTQDGKGGGMTNVQGRISLTFPQFSKTPYWHEIVVAYSPGSTTLRVNGVLIGTGVGISHVPPPDVRSQGFCVGGSANGSMTAQGEIDELETYNYPTSALEDSRKFVVLSASANSAPPQITLTWTGFSAPVPILRRSAGQEIWTTLSSNWSGFSYVDTDIEIGQGYEYTVADRLVFTGVHCSPIDERGRVILLIDNTLSKALAGDLDQLQQDLVGDGWFVTRHDVPRHDDRVWSRNPPHINAIKKLIEAEYHVAPAKTKAILILGHVAIPYSGYGGRDGHTKANSAADHQGAWPADGYYGDMVGKWTDSGQSYSNNYFVEQTNVPQDGKFDQEFFPAPLRIAVGRVDFARLPTLHKPPKPFRGKSELELLKQYLRKNHRYRHKLFSLPPRVTVAGKFNENAYDGMNQAMYFNSLRNGSSFFGLDLQAVVEGDLFIQSDAFLWGFQSGFGGPNFINNPPTTHQTLDLLEAAREPKVAFYVLQGSYFGDWNLSDNLLRATLATPTYGLGAIWAHNTAWRLESLAMGQPFSSGLLATINDTNQFPLGGPRDLALLGDPTLRLQILSPPSNLSAISSGAGKVSLKWEPSDEPGTKYFVYRGENFSAAFRRLSTTPIDGTTFTDDSASATQKLYQVRALRLTTTGSGSFTNLSQGIFEKVK